MNLNDPRGIIELGSSTIKCIIFQSKSDNSSEILSTAIADSEGLHNGVLVNLAKATSSIRSCISNAETQSGTSIKKINVILEEPEFLCTKFSKHRKIDGSKIQKDDIEFLLKEAKKQVVLNDNKQSIIHIFNHNYIVDGKTFIEEPIDVYANYLSHEMTFITMPKNNMKNINQAFIDCDIEIERYISSTFALSVKLLSKNEFQFGSTLIDIGYEKTSIGLFKNFALVHSATFPIGINHIAKDISKVCSLDIEESKHILSKIDFSFTNLNEIFDEKNNLRNIFFKKSTFRKISKSLIINIVKSRLDEMLEIIKKQIVISESDPNFKTNTFLVGGGSTLFNLEEYFSNFLSLNFKKISQKFETKLDQNFNSCLGALKIITCGWETEAIPEPANKYKERTGILARIFGN